MQEDKLILGIQKVLYCAAFAAYLRIPQKSCPTIYSVSRLFIETFFYN